MEHHDATGVTTPRQTVKASPHRHKWMLSHGAPADPSDPWNSHAAPVSPRQNCAFAAIQSAIDGFICQALALVTVDVRAQVLRSVPCLRWPRTWRPGPAGIGGLVIYGVPTRFATLR